MRQVVRVLCYYGEESWIADIMKNNTIQKELRVPQGFITETIVVDNIVINQPQVHYCSICGEGISSDPCVHIPLRSKG